MKNISIILCCISLISCASNVSREIDFDSSSSKSLVLIGVESDPGSKYVGNLVSIIFSKFTFSDDKQHQVNNKTWFKLKLDATLDSRITNNGLKHNLANKKFFLLKVDPGSYALRSINNNITLAGSTQHYNTCMYGNTFYFSLAPGEVSYLGDFEVSDNRSYGFLTVKGIGTDISGAKYYLNEAKDITANLVEIDKSGVSLDATCDRRS